MISDCVRIRCDPSSSRSMPACCFRKAPGVAKKFSFGYGVRTDLVESIASELDDEFSSILPRIIAFCRQRAFAQFSRSWKLNLRYFATETCLPLFALVLLVPPYHSASGLFFCLTGFVGCAGKQRLRRWSTELQCHEHRAAVQFGCGAERRAVGNV